MYIDCDEESQVNFRPDHNLGPRHEIKGHDQPALRAKALTLATNGLVQLDGSRPIPSPSRDPSHGGSVVGARGLTSPLG